MILRYSPLIAQFLVDNMPFLSAKERIDTYTRLRGMRYSSVGSLSGKLTLSDDWDSDEVNGEIARDFGYEQ